MFLMKKNRWKNNHKVAAAIPDTYAPFIPKDVYENKNKEFKKDQGVKTSP